MSELEKTIAIIGGTGGLGSALAFRWGQVWIQNNFRIS